MLFLISLIKRNWSSDDLNKVLKRQNNCFNIMFDHEADDLLFYPFYENFHFIILFDVYWLRLW